MAGRNPLAELRDLLKEMSKGDPEFKREILHQTFEAEERAIKFNQHKGEQEMSEQKPLEAEQIEEIRQT